MSALKTARRAFFRSMRVAALTAAMTGWGAAAQDNGAQKTAPSPLSDRSNAVYSVGYVPTDGEFADLVAKVRQSGLAYASRLRDFICTQTERRERRKEGAASWKLYSSLVKELTFHQGKEYYRVLSENGKPSNKKWEKVDGSKMSGEFGSLLRSVFEPASRSAFTFDGVAESSHTNHALLGFAIAQENSRLELRAKGFFTRREVLVAARGRCWVDPETLRIVRLEESAVDIPQDCPIRSMTVRVDYGEVGIAGHPYWLPKRSETTTLAHKTLYRNVIEFTDYHELDVRTNITFSEVVK